MKNITSNKMEIEKVKLNMNLKKLKELLFQYLINLILKYITYLKKFKIEIISSGGSFKKIKKMKYNCIEVSKYTGYF